MIKNSSIILCLFFMLSISAKSETNDSIDISNKIATALNSSNSKILSSYFSTTINLTIPEKEGSFSKTQAELIIKDFFTKNSINSFKLKSEGSSKSGAQYIIGSLITTKESYRVYILIKAISNKNYIQLLQIENE